MNKSYYAIIPANVRYDNDLTPNAKLLYGEITALCNEKGYCWASNEYFAELYKTSTRTVSRWIQQLTSKGYVTSKLIYRKGTKEVEQRHIYLSVIGGDKNVTTYGQKCHEGIDKNVTTPIDKNVQDNNTVFNNTNNISKYIDKENTPNKLKEFSNLYEQNIGLINGITAEYLIDLSETIDVDLFKRAIEIATDKGKCSLGYIKGIIKQWLDVNIKTLEQLEAYKLQQQSKKGVKTNGSSTKRTKQFEQQIPADDEKDEEYYRLLEECERLSRE